ncbi:hypothetical protein [Mobiluncus curtisii]|uniref:Uncharacterized protein n=1 Tax=Mobiluncus curtisii TaxID=2051 RepID=A0A2X3BQ78_9ACTO|nr:hypothetical protein [Mobiluncus curtisii]SQC01506.1 Uncharacterised protein [Mobiluncus curtisii]
MAMTNWAFPSLETKPGAWRRYWVVLVAFPDLFREVFADSTLEAFCLGMVDDPLSRKLFVSYMRSHARKERHALKALQNGTDVRDIPGATPVIQQFKTRFEELRRENVQGVSEQKLPLLVERLSTAACDYTFCENLQPRIADRVIGPSGRKIADALAQQWLDYPQLKYLNQRFHPRAQHLRFDSLDAVTFRQPSVPSAVQRTAGQLRVMWKLMGGRIRKLSLIYRVSLARCRPSPIQLPVCASHKRRCGSLPVHATCLIRRGLAVRNKRGSCLSVLRRFLRSALTGSIK